MIGTYLDVHACTNQVYRQIVQKSTSLKGTVVEKYKVGSGRPKEYGSVSLLWYLLLGHVARPSIMLFQDLAEPAVAHDHPVVQQEQLRVYLSCIQSATTTTAVFSA